MEVFTGTSGWSNPIWNPNGLSWYQQHSRLNAVELNMSFYQLPEKSQIEDWAREGNALLWSVKVNRSVTHLFRFNSLAREKFVKFRMLFAPLDEKIATYVFQLPPNAHPAIRNDIEEFFHFTNLGKRFALEWRNPKWFVKEHLDWARELGITVVSADCPAVPRDIMAVNDTVYLRLHGRSDWFLHHYSRKELSHIATSVINTGCKRAMVFLDNDSMQLKNARMFSSIINELNANSTLEVVEEK